MQIVLPEESTYLNNKGAVTEFFLVSQPLDRRSLTSLVKKPGFGLSPHLSKSLLLNWGKSPIALKQYNVCNNTSHITDVK